VHDDPVVLGGLGDFLGIRGFGDFREVSEFLLLELSLDLLESLLPVTPIFLCAVSVTKSTWKVSSTLANESP
jgi:hypothetical protein